MDLETARANMVEQQIRPWQVLEAQTLDALRRIRREDFVPPAHRHLAFADTQIPLQSAAPTDGAGENPDERAVMLEPKVTARMAESLNLSRDDRALLIGAGGGYTAALLATLAAHVTAVDID
ncbi:MAG: protein-L-isoaspartate O-methyltransferase, partial [Gammaproteobacteria bacterium]|nr:protein-L-isoaspartate O-methyltransferase [Gammaproteobacteria bacterium]